MNRLYHLSLLILRPGSIRKKPWLGTQMSCLGKSAPLLCGVDKTISLRNAQCRSSSYGRGNRVKGVGTDVGSSPPAVTPHLTSLGFHVNLGVEETSYPDQLGWEGISGPLHWSTQCTLCSSFSVRDTGTSKQGCSVQQSSTRPLCSPRSFVPRAAPR